MSCRFAQFACAPHLRNINDASNVKANPYITCSLHTDTPHCVAGAAILTRMCLNCNKSKAAASASRRVDYPLHLLTQLQRVQNVRSGLPVESDAGAGGCTRQT